MKIKKNPDPKKQAKAIEAPDEEMQDLDLETMTAPSGAKTIRTFRLKSLVKRK